MTITQCTCEKDEEKFLGALVKYKSYNIEKRNLNAMKLVISST
jgi:hypothetical protein